MKPDWKEVCEILEPLVKAQPSGWFRFSTESLYFMHLPSYPDQKVVWCSFNDVEFDLRMSDEAGVLFELTIAKRDLDQIESAFDDMVKTILKALDPLEQLALLGD